MAFNYARLAKVAQAQCKRFGLPVTVNRYTPTADEITGRSTKGAPSATGTPRAVGLGVKHRREPGTLTRIKTQGFLMPASDDLPFRPQADDEIVDSTGAVWIVKDCDVVVPAVSPIIYLVNTVAT